MEVVALRGELLGAPSPGGPAPAPRRPAKCKFQQSPSQALRGAGAPSGAGLWRAPPAGVLRAWPFAFCSPVGTSATRPAYGVWAGTAPPGPRGHPPTRWRWAPQAAPRLVTRGLQCGARRQHEAAVARQSPWPSCSCPYPPAHFVLSRECPHSATPLHQGGRDRQRAPQVFQKGVGHGAPVLWAVGIPRPPPHQGCHTG